MNEKQYPLDDNEDYLNSIDMSKYYNDKEIRDIYDVVFHRNDPKQIESVGKNTEKFSIGNIFIPKRFMSDKEAREKCHGDSDKNKFLMYTGEISQEEYYKREFIEIFKKELKKNKDI